MQPPDEFIQFFSKIYGSRWPAIFSSLQGEEVQVARPNAFTPITEWNGEGEIPRAENGLLTHYVMDPASIEAAKALNVQVGDCVLDMCAAPGGKTLILAEALGESGELIANELSEPRRERLKKVIQQYIPRNVRDHVFVTGKEGGRFAQVKAQYFDRVLVDAPCSGERHQLGNRKELAQWTESRSKKLAQRQYALLTAALLTAKPGARIVYSTCSISPYENDEVIAHLKKRKSSAFKVEKQVEKQVEKLETSVLAKSSKLSLAQNSGEPTEFGWQFLPDQHGWGPIYYCVLQVL